LMYDNQMDNQRFIDVAHDRREDSFMYMDPISGECLLVSGSDSSIQLLGEIVDDHEMVCEVIAGVVEEMDKLKEIGHAD
jgi:hypothetical protein